MSVGSICFAISAILFLLLGFAVISSTGKVDLVLVAAGLVLLELLLSGFLIPINFTRS